MMNAGVANSMCRSGTLLFHPESENGGRRGRRRSLECVCVLFFFFFFYVEAMQTHKQHEVNLLIAERED